MKLLPFAAALSCATLLAGCNRPASTQSDAEKQQQEELAEQQQAQLLSALHEREAALDERDRLLTEREQELALASPNPQQPAPPPVASAPVPAPSSPSPATDVTYQEFYDALSPYGTWVQMPGYGYVWQPLATVQDFRWRPYTLGHWIYTDDGWTWASDEPFGWLTYHYGRWMRTHTLGWVWFPGDEWAPAWVSWRYGNNFVGWAPLPPEARFDGATGIQQWADEQYDLGASDYTFVSAADFGEDNMADVEVPPDDNGPIFDDSNNETDIYYDTGAAAIFCYGPNYDFMRSKSRRQLAPPLTISRSGFRAGGNNGPVVSGNTLHVTAPRVLQPRRPVAPRTVHSSVADSRLVTRSAPQTLLGAAAQPQFTPSQVPIIPRPAAPPVPAQAETAPTSQTGPEVAVRNPPAPPQYARPPAPNLQPESNPASPPTEIQNDRDVELIRQQQAERERQAEAAKAADQARQAEETRAAEAARADREAADEQAAKAAREEEASREESAPAAQSQPASAPVGSPAGFPVR